MTLRCPFPNCNLEIVAETGREMSAKVRSHTLEVHGRTDEQIIREFIDNMESAAKRYPYEQYLKDIGK